MEKLEKILNLVITTLLSWVCIACNTTNNEHHTNDGKMNQNQEIDTPKIEKFRYYDLFSMQGIEPYNGDSAVIVTQTNDSIILNINFPERYSRAFRNMGSYWYSHSEFDMDKNRYYLTLSESWPIRYDMFVVNDTIIEYCQTFYRDEVIKDIYLKTSNAYYKIGWIKESSEDSDPDKMIIKAKDFFDSSQNNKNAEYYIEASVIRDKSRITFTNVEKNTKIYGYFPGPIVWGGEYEFGSDRHILLQLQ